jgi:NDP-sugar pyrophosphorylase family protein
VPVCGKPLIEHVVRRLKSAGIDEAVVNVHHFADKVEAWVAEQDLMEISISDERQMLLETGGAVLHARPYLDGCGSFLIHNVDILSNVDLGWFMSQVQPGALAALLVSERKSSRYLLFDPETMRLVGWKNENTGEIRPAGIQVEESECIKLAFSGIHIMSDRVFDVMEGYPERFPVIDFYLDNCHLYEIYGVKAENMHLIDVGKLDTLELAERFLNEL